MSYSTILFDMDGVLVNSERRTQQVIIDMLKEMGIQAKNEDFVPFTGMGEDRFIGGVIEKYGHPYHPEMKKIVYERYASYPLDYPIVFPGAKEMLLELKKRGFKIAVASSADKSKVFTNLRFIGVSPADFDTVITGSDVSRNKPDPEIYNLAAARIGSPASRCIVVEDAVAGVTAGKRAGMYTIAVLGSFPKDDLVNAGADIIVENTVDILNIVDKL